MRGLALVFIILFTRTSLANCPGLESAPGPLAHALSVRPRGADVWIRDDQIERVAHALVETKFEIKAATWNFPPYPGDDVSFDEMFIYFLALDSINYMYRDAATGKTYGTGTKLGAGLLAERLTLNRRHLLTPAALTHLTLDHAEELFWAATPLPDVPSRVERLNSVGRFLNQRPRGEWLEWLRQFPSALSVAQHIAAQVKGFDDPFLKRAQLFVGMLVGRFGEHLPPGVRNLEGFTAYADYILPMVMRRLGILVHSGELSDRIDRGEIIPAGSREEIRIRAATLIAADRLLTALRKSKRYEGISALDLDTALWLQGKEIQYPGSVMPEHVFRHGEKPHHQTITTYY